MYKKLIKTLEQNNTYKLLLEEWSVDGIEKTEVVAAYSSIDGGYIGDISDLIYLVGKKGIAPQKAEASHSTCSIGFCEDEQKWYGWSHRAMFGFGIGHITKEGDCQTVGTWTKEYLLKHPEPRSEITPIGFECKTLEDCKKVAISFARSVG